MHLSGFDLFAWAASFVGQVVLLLVLIVRHRARSFPIFTTFIAEEIVASLVKYFAFYHLSIHVYRYCFWSIGILDEILQILVFYEIAVHVFCPTGVWARDVRRTFIGLVSASSAIALLLSWLTLPATYQPVQTYNLRSNFF